MEKGIIPVLKRVLKKNKKIKFAYLFGSFVEEGTYNDIDIGIFIQPLQQENIFKITADLKCRISRALTEKDFVIKPDKIDIVVLNCVSFTFLNRILKYGKLIFDRAFELRTDIIEKNANTYRACVGLLAEARIL